MGIVDSVEDLVSLMNSNWDSGNTNSRTPVFNERWDEPARLDVRNNDYVLCYPNHGIISQKNGLGTATWRLNFPNTLDIWTSYSRQHSIDMINEVVRILNANILTPGSDYDWLEPTPEITDLSDKTKQVWRFVVNMRFVQANTAR